MTSEKILGIDLGTTNSACAIVEEDSPVIIPNREGERTTPSVVAIQDNDEQLVGKKAKNQAIQNPTNTVQSIKRMMGQDGYTVELQGEEFTPEMVSSKIIRKLKQDSEDYLGEEIQEAVITVPAYFTDKQRQATKDAGEIAGFDVQRIINEPTAAAMAYGVDQDEEQTVMVYDLGGGTFDVSILEIGGGVLEVIATAGNNELGGDDWDRVLLDWVVEQFEEDYDINLKGDFTAIQRLTNAVEEAKIELSSYPETDIHVPFIASDEESPYDADYSISRQQFESMTSHLTERTVGPMEEAMQEASVSVDDIDEVVLVGGMTRMPAIRQTVKEHTGQQPRKDVNPDEAVALGAAVQGSVMTGETDDVLLLDVTPLSLGVEVSGGIFERVIPKNTKIPVSETKEFTTSDDKQTEVEIRVWQGEREIAEKNELLDEFVLTGIPPAEAGVPKIDVEFRIDANGIVNVSATNKETGRSEEIEIEGGVGMSDEKIEELRNEAEQNAEEDRQRRRKIEARNRVQEVIRQAEDFLAENQDLDDEYRSGLSDLIDEAEALVDDESMTIDQLNAACDQFDEILSEVAEEVGDTEHQGSEEATEQSRLF